VKKLYIGNLDWKVTEDDLRSFFSAFGDIKYAKVVKDKETGRSKGFGFVEFVDESKASAVFEQSKLGKFEILGRAIAVREAIEKPR